jgi:selenocysteine lyase/cysteine desulfurase
MSGGYADSESIRALVDGRTRVVSVSAVQYSSGHRYDLPRLAAICHARDALFVVDGTQAVGAMRIQADASGVDVLAASAHKWMLGPSGIGFVHFSERAMDRLTPSVVGWRAVEDPFAFDHEPTLAADARRFESGTENAAGIAGLNAAVGLVLEIGPDAVEQLVLTRADELADALRTLGLQVHRGTTPERRSGIVVATTGGDDAAVHARLLEREVRCSLRNGLRFAPHIYTSSQDVDVAAEVLREAIR